MSENEKKVVSNSLRQFRFNAKGSTETNSNGNANLKIVPGKRRIQTIAEDSDSDIDTSDLSVVEKERRLIFAKNREPCYSAAKIQGALVVSKWDVDKAISFLKSSGAKKIRVDPDSFKPIAIPEYDNKDKVDVKKRDSSEGHKSSSDHHRSSSGSNPSPHKHKSDHNGRSSGGSVSSPNKSHSSPNKSESHPHRSSSSHSSHRSSHHHHHSSSSTSKHGSSSTSSRHHSHHHSNGSSKHSSESSSHKKKKSKHDSDDGSENEAKKPKRNVFESDEDSDHEVSKAMSKDRTKVFEFMNTSNDKELLLVKTCSSRKVDAIIESRPFKNWKDLVKKFQNHKVLSSEILNYCQDLIYRRNKLSIILKKCTKLVDRLETAVAAGAGVSKQPSNLCPEYKLADYQMIGLNWLAVMHKENTNGILADEMGLGKTIQVIAFLAYLKLNGLSTKPHLIVVPSSTLNNWDEELEKWCPDLKVAKYYGSQDERKSLRIQWSRGGLQDVDVLLTTYHTVGSTPEERKMFRVTPLQYVIFDEAHMLKNMTTQRYINLMRINADRRILLTGTPLQNNLLELMSLLCFVMPTLFAGNADDLKSLFQKSTAKSAKTESAVEDELNAFEQNQIVQAKRIMKPFVLRRLKNDVLKSLPPKTQHKVKIKMATSQKEQYNELVESYKSETGIVKATHDQSGMAMMMDMRKLSNHPLLMRYYYSDEDVRQIAKRLSTNILYKGENSEYIFQDLAIMSDFQIYQLILKYSIKSMKLPDEYILDSGKFNEFDIMLPKLKEEGHRVLIFSQFTMMLDIMEKYLEIRDYGFMRLDGQTAVTDRQDMINDYNADSDYFIFLLSTKAGGLGINLTAADTVIIHDIDFNPYNDKQAEDRCHRMGQTKPVNIYKFVTDGTIEEGMFMVAQQKLNLEKEVTNDSEVKEEHKCMVRLLTMALGMDEKKAENMISPSPKKKSKNNCDEVED